ncbi:transposase [Methylicorpusculum sp.]|uniref:transposase n=1 Tax=Methylicorpusculum sp. TaxID=2713644 RepID=UPI00351F2765
MKLLRNFSRNYIPPLFHERHLPHAEHIRHHSWERGLNENHNGLLRQYFPKLQPLDQVTQAHVNKALAGLNHRPRKTLNYKTPWEVFCKMAGLDTDNLLGVAFMG